MLSEVVKERRGSTGAACRTGCNVTKEKRMRQVSKQKRPPAAGCRGHPSDESAGLVTRGPGVAGAIRWMGVSRAELIAASVAGVAAVGFIVYARWKSSSSSAGPRRGSLFQRRGSVQERHADKRKSEDESGIPPELASAEDGMLRQPRVERTHSLIGGDQTNDDLAAAAAAAAAAREKERDEEAKKRLKKRRMSELAVSDIMA